MKTLILIIAFTITVYKAYSQNSDSIRYDSIYTVLNDTTETEIWFGCGWAGAETANLHLFRTLIQNNRAGVIQKLLDSKNPATKYLAAKTLLALKKKWPLDSIMELKINTIKGSAEAISFCSGCTVHETHAISFLFKMKDSYFSELTDQWVEDSML